MLSNSSASNEDEFWNSLLDEDNQIVEPFQLFDNVYYVGKLSRTKLSRTGT